MANNKIACVMVLAIILIAPQVSVAVTCGQVVGWLLPCLAYLKNGVGPTDTCCNGVKTLYNNAKNTQDRQTACACIKQSAKSYSIDYGYANTLAPKCSVQIDYKIAPDFDCSTVH